MPKDDVIEFEGVVVEALPNATFKVKLPNDMPAGRQGHGGGLDLRSIQGKNYLAYKGLSFVPPHRRLSENKKGGKTVKVKPSVKKICEKCKIIKRHGHVMVICENPKHKQRQG